MPAIHRDGDSRTCGATTIVSGQSSVFANNKLISVEGDQNSHNNGALKASNSLDTVFIENKKIVVVGSDAFGDNSDHSNPASSNGSSDLFAFG